MVAAVAPLFAERETATVNIDVRSHPVKSTVTSPVAVAPGTRSPTGRGNIPGATFGVQGVPPVRVNARLVMAVLSAAPIPALNTRTLQMRAAVAPVLLVSLAVSVVLAPAME